MTSTQITSITYKPDHSEPADGFTRVAVQQVNLIANYGIEGDRKGGHPTRQLNMMSQATLDALAQQGFNTAPGAMGEQMIVSGLDVDALAVGVRLRLGAQAVIEVTDHRTGCARFEHIQGHDRAEAAGQMGIMAKVITSGVVMIGDSIEVLS